MLTTKVYYLPLFLILHFAFVVFDWEQRQITETLRKTTPQINDTYMCSVMYLPTPQPRTLLAPNTIEYLGWHRPSVVGLCHVCVGW